MRILISNFALFNQAGTETYSFELCKQLNKLGIEVFFYSAYIGKYFRKKLDLLGIQTTTDLEAIKEVKFDIIHAQHNLNAIELRYYFQNIPMVYQQHGTVPFLESLPPFNININHYLAVSKNIERILLKKGVDKNNITVSRNFVDSKKFYSYKQINKKPGSALILSNKINKTTQNIISKATQELGIKTDYVGKNQYVNNFELPKIINQYDIVFTLGRGAIEAMMCKRIPIIFDIHGGDGLVTPSNFNKLRKLGFSGKLYSHQYTVEDLKKEIGKYNSSYGSKLRNLAIKYFDSTKNIKKILAIYQKVIKQGSINLTTEQVEHLSFVYNAISRTRYATSHYSEFKHTKFYNLFRFPYKLKDKIIKNLNQKGLTN